MDKDRLIEELREAVRARDEFVAIAAHELRNPMTPILLQVESLLATVDRGHCEPELLKPRIERLERAVRAFVRRATSLLDVSRMLAGNLQIEPSRVDLSGVLGEVLERLAPAAEVACCRIERALQEGVVGVWDRLALEQIAENLLSNALKFGAGRPVAVAVRADDGMARLIVRDQGIGISGADRGRIFERFERAVVRREHGGGFGVGLWLVCQLVRAMDGRIDLESVPGQGASFTVSLPLHPIDADHGAAA